MLDFETKALKKEKRVKKKKAIGGGGHHHPPEAPAQKPRVTGAKEEKKVKEHDEDEAKRDEDWVEIDRYSVNYDRKNTPERIDDLEKLRLKDIYERPAMNVLKRALFLLEIRVSVDY